eukprot:g1728.t1
MHVQSHHVSHASQEKDSQEDSLDQVMPSKPKAAVRSASGDGENSCEVSPAAGESAISPEDVTLGPAPKVLGRNERWELWADAGQVWCGSPLAEAAGGGVPSQSRCLGLF